MGAARRVHTPASRVPVEGGIAFQRHDQVDLSLRMGVVRTGDVLHIHHIHREALQRVVCLENAAVADAATLALAKPALRHTSQAPCLDLLVCGTIGPVRLVQPSLQITVQASARDLSGQLGQGFMKCGFIRHGDS